VDATPRLEAGGASSSLTSASSVMLDPGADSGTRC
jgi:hypothetical protein